PAASTSSAAVPAGAYVVQIAAVRSEAEAQATWRTAQSRYSDLLRNQPFSVKRADLGDKGIYYRAQVGNFSAREGAVSLCEALRAQGTTCMVARN
ncbi:SPOR domain-containing protein, partial [Ancylobacter vacuolatus]